MAQHPKKKDGPQRPVERITGKIPTGPITDDTEIIFAAGQAFINAVKHEQTVDHHLARFAEERKEQALVAERLATAAQTYLVSIGRYGRPPGGPGLATDISIAEAELRAALEAYSGDST